MDKGTPASIYQTIDFLNLHRSDLVLILSRDYICSMDYRNLIRLYLDKESYLKISCTMVGQDGASSFGCDGK